MIVDESTITMGVTVPYGHPDGTQDVLVGLSGRGYLLAH
jgi:hypothetical protein